MIALVLHLFPWAMEAEGTQPARNGLKVTVLKLNDKSTKKRGEVGTKSAVLDADPLLTPYFDNVPGYYDIEVGTKTAKGVTVACIDDVQYLGPAEFKVPVAAAK